MHPELLLISPDDDLRQQAIHESSGLPLRINACTSMSAAERFWSAASPQGRTVDEPRYLLVDLAGSSYQEARRWASKFLPDSRTIFLRGDASGAHDRGAPVRSAPSLMFSGEAFVDRPGGGSEVRELLERVSLEMISPAENEVIAGGLDALIGRSVAFRLALEAATKAAADADTPALIAGDAGTGKRLFARAIHSESRRSGHQLVEVDCRAAPVEALDSLLGQDYSGGRLQSASLDEAHLRGADGGSLLLREITALAPPLQARLATYIDAHRLWRIQQLCRPRADLRVIATTSGSLEKQVRAGEFHSELYDRLSRHRISLPALRERPSDTLLLADYFLRHRAALAGHPVPRLTSAAREMLIAHPWQENVRELVRVLQGVLVELGDGNRIDERHLAPALERALSKTRSRMQAKPATPSRVPASSGTLPAEQKQAACEAVNPAPAAAVPAPSRPAEETDGLVEVGVYLDVVDGGVRVTLPDEGVAFEEIEKAVLIAALKKTGGNVVRAARLLKMGRGSLRYRLEKYALVEPKRRGSRTRAQSRDADEGLRRAS